MATATMSTINHPIHDELARMRSALERLELWAKDLSGSPQPTPVRREVSIDDILGWVAYEWGMRAESILRHGNAASMVEPRHAAMYLAAKLTAFSFPAIGKRMGGYHHTSVIHAFRKIEHWRQTDALLNKRLVAIEERLA